MSAVLGVVVIHDVTGAAMELPSVDRLLPQVDELLLVHNGGEKGEEPDGTGDPRVRSIAFPANRGTAAAWNAALAAAQDGGHRHLYLLDQDSTPYTGAVDRARTEIGRPGVAAVVQPAAPDRLGLDPFPWNTVASGALLDVDAALQVGGFDERLFVDEVDHELFDRLMRAGYGVVPLVEPTIDHRVGSPRDVRRLGVGAQVTGHGPARRRLQGFSGGLLVRRNVGKAPSIAARLLARYAVTAAKDVAAGERRSARALVSGFFSGMATGRPPANAATRPCPYCEGPLLGRYGAVADWRFGTGPPADVYQCARCGALASGRAPAPEEVASWYAGYYTHTPAADQSRRWSRLWPTPRRRREMERMRWYLASPGAAGRFLEVGAGAGERLVQFAAAGWDVVGQDVDPSAGCLAESHGLTVHRCSVAELVGREQPFELIGLNHVLEHAVDPGELLQACAALLAPGGRMCVVTPNAGALGRRLFGRWWYGLEQPRHLGIPTPESLGRLGERIGLKPTYTATVPTNAAVILGGSLARPFEERLPAGRPRQAARFGSHLVGQVLGRAAALVSGRLGEELVWVGYPAVRGR